MKDKLSIESLFVSFLLAIRISFTTIPMVNVHSGFLVNFGSLAILYAMIIYFYNNHHKNYNYKSAIFLYSLYILGILSSIFDISQLGVNVYVLFQDALWFFAGFYILANNNQKQARLILLFLAASLVYTGFTTYVGNKLFPLASRILTTGMFENQDRFLMFKNMNIGDFNYIYLITLFVPLLIYTSRLSVIGKVVSLIAIIGVLLLAVVTEFTTALIFSTFATLFLFLPQDFRKTHILSLVALLAIIVVVFPAIFSLIAENTDSELFSERFSSLFDLTTTGNSGLDNADSDLGARFDAWELSLSGFLSSPLIGTGSLGGSHSYIFDNMCKYGILGIVCLIAIFTKMYRLYVIPYRKSDFGAFIYLVFMMNLFLCFVNTVNNFFMVTFIIPLFLVAFRDKIKPRRIPF